MAVWSGTGALRRPLSSEIVGQTALVLSPSSGVFHGDVFRGDEEVITSGNGEMAFGCRGVAVFLIKGHVGGSHRVGPKLIA